MPDRTAQIAQADGIYRCTGIGSTKWCDSGATLPLCNCNYKGKECRWELLKKDNMETKNAIVVFVGKGIFHAIETDELPEKGHCFNIREDLGVGLRTGRYRIVEVDDNFRWQGKSHFRVQVERIGDLAGNLPIHQARMMNC